MQIGETTVFVDFFKKREGRPAGETSNYTNLYVKHFPESWTEETLQETFSAHGEISSSVMMTDGKGRRFAFVDFKESDNAKAAVEALNRKDMRPEEEQKGEAPTEDEHPEEEQKGEAPTE